MGSWRIYRLSLVMSENLHWKLFPIYNNPSPPLQASPWYGVEGLCLVAVGSKVTLLPIPLGSANFLVFHIHAFTIYVTVFILLKAVMFSRSPFLIPE